MIPRRVTRHSACRIRMMMHGRSPSVIGPSGRGRPGAGPWKTLKITAIDSPASFSRAADLSAGVCKAWSMRDIGIFSRDLLAVHRTCRCGQRADCRRTGSAMRSTVNASTNRVAKCPWFAEIKLIRTLPRSKCDLGEQETYHRRP